MNNHEQKIEKKISDSVLERIEYEKTAPRPREYFILRNVVLWVLAVVSLVLGALAVSSIIFRLANVPRIMHPGGMGFEASAIPDLLRLLPLLWIVALGFFGYLAYREIRKTREGYKYELSTILLSMVVISGVLGALLYVAGSGYVLDRAASRVVPFHADVELLQRDAWQSPQGGFLMGEVLKTDADGFSLEDIDRDVWLVSYGESLAAHERSFIKMGMRVGVKGAIVDEEKKLFIACAVRSLEIEGKGMFLMHRAPLKTVALRTVEPDERKIIVERMNECEGVRPPFGS